MSCAAPGARAAVRTVFRFLQDGTKVRLALLLPTSSTAGGAAGSTLTCFESSSARREPRSRTAAVTRGGKSNTRWR